MPVKVSEKVTKAVSEDQKAPSGRRYDAVFNELNQFWHGNCFIFSAHKKVSVGVGSFGL
jgi:hypothetical protein